MIFLNYGSSAERWCSTCLVCVHTDTERKQIKPRVRDIFESSKKNTIFNEHPVFQVIVSNNQELIYESIIFHFKLKFIFAFKPLLFNTSHSKKEYVCIEDTYCASVHFNANTVTQPWLVYCDIS